MPKRFCPFQYDLLPQLKIHLSEKEVFTTTESQKQVHDKTIAMLFNGARSPPGRPRLAPVCGGSSSTIWDHKKRLTQLCLNSECRLDRPAEGRVVCAQEVACGCLSTRDANPSVTCGSCDRRVCLECIVACQLCRGDVCKTCVQAIFATTDCYTCRDCT